jgi:hypothetical protein
MQVTVGSPFLKYFTASVHIQNTDAWRAPRTQHMPISESPDRLRSWSPPTKRQNGAKENLCAGVRGDCSPDSRSPGHSLDRVINPLRFGGVSAINACWDLLAAGCADWAQSPGLKSSSSGGGGAAGGILLSVCGTRVKLTLHTYLHGFQQHA